MKLTLNNLISKSAGNFSLNQTFIPPVPQLGKLPAPPKDAIFVVPLGGCGGIGLNATLYGHDGQWILVDSGVAFAERKRTEYRSRPQDPKEIQSFLLDPAQLIELDSKLAGAVFTHGHEDHIGAVPLMWPRLRTPIYATPYASEMIALKIGERSPRDFHRVQINRFEIGDVFNMGPFTVEAVATSHSTVECVSLVIRAMGKTIMHTGDWKIDPTPLLGQSNNLERFAQLGEEGVDLLLGDSTNAEKPGMAGSEALVIDGLQRIMEETQGTVVVACFSSHLARHKAAAIAARRVGRILGAVGRSMTNAHGAAFRSGHIANLKEILSPDELAQYLRNQRVLLTTGVQGEIGGGLDRLLNGKFAFNLTEGDTIIFSGREIPGNEEAIERLKMRARDRGVRVVSADEEFDGKPIHVSGHGCQGDMAILYALVKPKTLIPIHGGADHLEAHAKVAKEAGIDNVLVPRDGLIICLDRHGVRATGQILPRHVGWNGVYFISGPAFVSKK